MNSRQGTRILNHSRTNGMIWVPKPELIVSGPRSSGT